jgi:small subunit ribosomal protein S27Ae
MANERKGKKKAKQKPTSQKWKKYKIEGGSVKREKTCPRCGPGVFLMETNNRIYCGKCHWTEFKTGSNSSKEDK